MKILNIIILLASLNAFSQTSAPENDGDPLVYVAKHQGYTCERWGQKGYKLSSFEEELKYKFEYLAVSKTTRKAQIKITQDECEYVANFSRQKGNTFVKFETSTINNPETCAQVKTDLDLFMAEGWDYKIQLNKYLSVKFASPIESKCTELTGESYARFMYDVLSEL